MELKFPTFYLVTCLDTRGDTWTFERGQWPSDNTVHTREVTDASQLTQLDPNSMQELRKLLQSKSAAFWEQSLEDYEEGDVPLTLNTSTLRFHRVESVVSTLPQFN